MLDKLEIEGDIPMAKVPGIGAVGSRRDDRPRPDLFYLINKVNLWVTGFRKKNISNNQEIPFNYT